MNRISIALLHYPVLDKEGNIYTTAITNMDVHDIARSSCTYGLKQYYVVSPIEAQRQMAQTIANFWLLGGGQNRNQDRSRAMELIKVGDSLESCLLKEEKILGQKPLIIATSAKSYKDKNISFLNLKEELKAKSAIILLGTGYGLHESILDLADVILDPILGLYDYNHLSVRSAAAIILDRLFG